MEAQAPGARGFAHSGPILGIHPFQATAIVIHGYGPFDLPINDYVEPDGSRGYGPAALAEALQRDLAAIAEQQFADGPARAYQAFAGARGGGGGAAGAAGAPRLRRSRPGRRSRGWWCGPGTTGWRSRVESRAGERDAPGAAAGGHRHGLHVPGQVLPRGQRGARGHGALDRVQRGARGRVAEPRGLRRAQR